jgi:hypothetical protein
LGNELVAESRRKIDLQKANFREEKKKKNKEERGARLSDFLQSFNRYQLLVGWLVGWLVAIFFADVGPLHFSFTWAKDQHSSGRSTVLPWNFSYASHSALGVRGD